VAIMDLCSRMILGVTVSYSMQTRTSTIEPNSQTDVTDNEIWGRFSDRPGLTARYAVGGHDRDRICVELMSRK